MAKTVFWLLVANEIRGLIFVAMLLWRGHVG